MSPFHVTTVGYIQQMCFRHTYSVDLCNYLEVDHDVSFPAPYQFVFLAKIIYPSDIYKGKIDHKINHINKSFKLAPRLPQSTHCLLHSIHNYK